METSDKFWFLGVVSCYLGELFDGGILLTDKIGVGSVLDDLCRLAGVPACLEIEVAVSSITLHPRLIGDVGAWAGH